MYIPFITDSLAKDKVGAVDDAAERRLPTDWPVDVRSALDWLGSTVETGEFPLLEPSKWFTIPLEATACDVGGFGRIGGQHGHGSP